MFWKNILVVLLSGWLMACGSSSDGDEGLYQELERYKGEAQEPVLTVIVEREEDSVEINSHVYGEFEGNHTVLFQYTALKEGRVALILNSSASEVTFSLTGDSVDQGAIIDSGNIALVFTAELDEFYEIRMRSKENYSVPYQFKIVEANRSSLGLSDSEYWVNSIVNDRTVCGDSESSTSYTYGRIFNFEQGYVSYGDGVKIADLDLRGGLNFSYIESYSNEEFSYSYNYDTELNSDTGSVVGVGIFTGSYLDEGCEGISNYEGKILL